MSFRKILLSQKVTNCLKIRFLELEKLANDKLEYKYLFQALLLVIKAILVYEAPGDTNLNNPEFYNIIMNYLQDK
jgi:hypothetical protein